MLADIQICHIIFIPLKYGVDMKKLNVRAMHSGQDDFKAAISIRLRITMIRLSCLCLHQVIALLSRYWTGICRQTLMEGRAQSGRSILDCVFLSG